MLRKTRVVCNAVTGCLMAAMLFAAGQVHALEAEHEMRRLMLATESAVNAGQWAEAGDYLSRLQQMDQQKPADYLFYRGRVMLESGQLNEAQSALEGYVGRVGAEGEHYTDALILLTEVEKARGSRQISSAQTTDAASEPVAVIEPAGEASIKKLRQLYLADSDAEALVIHLNTLLDNAGWRADSRVVRLDKPADIRYQVNRLNDSVKVQQARLQSDGRVMRTTESFNVFGVNPRVRWECEPVASACWIYDPRDGLRLMQLTNDSEAAAEIAQTLGRLIRLMQAPD